VRALRVGSASTALSERILLVLGGILAPLGLVVVVLGWWGASRTSYPFEQTPYLISGGLLGLGLVFLGSFFYFAHWLTQLVKEHREQSVAILAALERLAEQLGDQR
jgi:predicted membrane chloride channel (bestrophin family)